MVALRSRDRSASERLGQVAGCSTDSVSTPTVTGRRGPVSSEKMRTSRDPLPKPGKERQATESCSGSRCTRRQ